jgi:transcriptional regulator with XRE-family HTH domain
VRVEEIIGYRIRRRREAMELSQEQLGQRIGELLGREWPRQAISAAEKGKRSFAASELLAIAHVLGVSVGRLLSPPAETESIELASGCQLPRSALIGAALDRSSLERTFDEMMQALVRLGEQQKVIAEAAVRAGEDVAKLREMLWAEGFLRSLQVTETWDDEPADEAEGVRRAVQARDE